jgi:hypothetical protein
MYPSTAKRCAFPQGRCRVKALGPWQARMKPEIESPCFDVRVNSGHLKMVPLAP